MFKAPNGVSNDPQLQAVNGFTEAESLLEVILKKFYAVDRAPADPFFVRLVIAGEKKRDVTAFVGSVLPELLNTAVATSENPFAQRNDKVVTPSGILIEYDSYFIQFVEGYERHILLFLKLLEKHCAQKEGAVCSDVRILFLTDDIPSPTTSFFVHVDKAPATSTEGEIQEKTEEEIVNMIVDDVHNMMKLLDMAANEPLNKRKLFLDNVRVTHPLVFPRASSIKMYLKGDLFLTLSEYVSVFGKIPEVVRDVELNHPVEDPLKY